MNSFELTKMLLNKSPQAFGLSQGEYWTLVKLAYFYPNIHPSIVTLEEMIGTDRRNVKKYIKSLSEKGFITDSIPRKDIGTYIVQYKLNLDKISGRENTQAILEKAKKDDKQTVLVGYVSPEGKVYESKTAWHVEQAALSKA